MFTTRNADTLRRLQPLPMYQLLSRRQRHQLARSGTVIDAEVGRKLMTEDHLSGHETFIVITGQAVITRSGEVLGHLGPGDVFGELAVLGVGRLNVTVAPSTTMTVFALSAAKLRRLVDTIPPFADQVLGAPWGSYQGQVPALEFEGPGEFAKPDTSGRGSAVRVQAERDGSEVTEAAASTENTETTEIVINGANCAFCLNDTLEKLRAQPGVVDAQLSATDHCLRVEHEGSDLKPYLDVVRSTLHGVVKYGNELMMVEVDPEVARRHCTHH